MLTPVDFDDQRGLETGEISDERPDWHLTSEPFAVELPTAQVIPEA